MYRSKNVKCCESINQSINQSPLIWFILLAMSLPIPDDSQIPQTSTSSISYTTPPALIALTLSVVVLCFLCFSIIYFCRFYFIRLNLDTWTLHRSASGTVVRLSPNASPYRGLDPSLLQAFPTFLYSSVKDLRKEKYNLECSICLLEFEDDNMLRLLNVCCHVFHQECIDLWLLSNKTCPVCRTDLDSPNDEMQKVVDLNGGENNNDADVEESRRDEVCIDMDVDVGGRVDDDEEEGSLQEQGEQKFQRSHSTGHSIVMIRGEENEGKGEYDKYTLRLPEQVALKLVRGGHNYTKSCSSYNEMMIRPVAPCSNCGFVQTLPRSSPLSVTQNT